MTKRSWLTRVLCTQQALLVGTLTVSVGLTACGSTSSSSSSAQPAVQTSQTSSQAKAAVAAPSGLASAGSLTVCADMGYPPEISLQNGQPSGYDYDVGVAVGKEMGLTTHFVQTPLAAVISSLNAKRCDAIINSFSISTGREAVVSFVPYGQYGYTIMVKQGNPKHVSTIADVCGLAVGGPVGSNYITLLQAQSKTCKTKGHGAVTVVGYQTDGEGVQALVQGKLDGYMEDCPPSHLYLTRTKGQTQAGGILCQSPFQMGIVVRKDNPAMKAAISEAVKNLYANGQIPAIYKKWGLPQLVLKNAPVISG